MPARTILRTATAAKHEAVDAAYGRFHLADPASYGRFLTAHARALPGFEQVLGQVSALPRFMPRARLLQDDLFALRLTMPATLPVARPESDAAAFGMLYVVEGSRLGGAILARSVPATLPRAYLSAVHPPGAWRAFGELLDQVARAGGPGWIEQAVIAAEATFDLYAAAAARP